jgi:hypothetical protein
MLVGKPASANGDAGIAAEQHGKGPVIAVAWSPRYSHKTGPDDFLKFR